MTTAKNPLNLRSLVIRAWWDGQTHPSIECPIGDFMGFAHGKVTCHIPPRCIRWAATPA